MGQTWQKLKNRIQHIFNSQHIFCRLRDVGVKYNTAVWISLKWEVLFHGIIYGGIMSNLLAGCLRTFLTEKLIIKVVLELLKYLAKRSSNTLDDRIVKTVEKETAGQ